MIGICGWAGPARVEPGEATLRRGAAAFATFPDVRYAGSAGEAAGLLIATRNRSPQIAREAGFVAAVLGKPGFLDRPLGQVARDRGHARAVLEGYREHGDAVVERLTGGFAIAVVAEDGSRACLAVDRIGGRFPLCFRSTAEGIVFGSTADAVRACGGMSDELDPQAIFDYLYFSYVPSPRTAWKGIVQISPGSCLTLDRGEIRCRVYWQPEYDDHARPELEPLEQEFLATLRASVRRSVELRRQVGGFLSGGTDSSTIAGMLGEVSGRPARTFSIGFEADGFDELEYARAASRRFGTDHHEYYLTPDDVLDLIPTIARSYSEPFGNASAVPVFVCARLAREHGVRTLLAGDGGDELFAGNKRYRTQQVFEHFESIPAPVRRGLIEPLVDAFPGLGRVPIVRKGISYVRQARLPMPDRMESYNHLERAGIENVLDPGFLASIDPAEPLRLLRDVYGRARAGTMLNRMLALDLKFTLADADLPKVSRMCAAAGVDVVYPFLDDELVEFSLRVPARWKLRGAKLRWFMKHALRDYLPAEILVKKKHGFGLPFGVWMRDHDRLREFARETLRSIRTRGYVQAEWVDDLERRHATEHATYYGVMIWLLVILESWLAGRDRVLEHDLSGIRIDPPD